VQVAVGAGVNKKAREREREREREPPARGVGEEESQAVLAGRAGTVRLICQEILARRRLLTSAR
jgi:hypothetical protein